MNYSLKRRLYEGMPGFLKAPVGWIPFAWLAGRAYRETMRRGPMIEAMSRSEILAYQERALHSILTFACEQVPAYRPFKSLVSSMPALDAIREFPLLDKSTLQKELPKFLPRDFDKIPHYVCTTGGTSGSQLEVYLDDKSQSIELAFVHRLWGWVGYHPSFRKATFRGVNFGRLKPGIYWQHNPIYNELQFSPYHLNEKTLPAYLEALFRFRPLYIHGYPSAVSTLAAYAMQQGVDLRCLGLKAAILCSEAVYPDQRELIENAFGARAFSFYGHSERVILGGECEKDTAYHHFPDYGFVEILREDGTPVEEGETGELVGTGFWNRCLPLIRYRTGDLARRLPPSCSCGRCFDRFDSVEGRWKLEYVVGLDNSRISMAALNVHGPEFARVLRYQYYQKEPGKVELRIMAAAEFNSADLDAICKLFERKLGRALEVKPVVVENIPLTQRGKLRRLVQEYTPVTEQSEVTLRNR